jgi:hypothetical protein
MRRCCQAAVGAADQFCGTGCSCRIEQQGVADVQLRNSALENSRQQVTPAWVESQQLTATVLCW